MGGEGRKGRARGVNSHRRDYKGWLSHPRMGMSHVEQRDFFLFSKGRREAHGHRENVSAPPNRRLPCSDRWLTVRGRQDTVPT